MTEPYYSDEQVTLYLGNCLEVDVWLSADVLVTDPPYGIAWKMPELPPLKDNPKRRYSTASHSGIMHDADTSARDDVLQHWKGRPAAVFGAPNASLSGVKQTLVWQKPSTTGLFGTVAGFRRDWEAIYLLGQYPAGEAKRSSVIKTSGHHTAYLDGRHPHSKPVAVLEVVLQHMPVGVVADPFAGSGSTLIAARNLGRRVIGVEIEERYCELIASRLSQACFDFGEGA